MAKLDRKEAARRAALVLRPDLVQDKKRLKTAVAALLALDEYYRYKRIRPHGED